MLLATPVVELMEELPILCERAVVHRVRRPSPLMPFALVIRVDALEVHDSRARLSPVRFDRLVIDLACGDVQRADSPCEHVLRNRALERFAREDAGFYARFQT